MSTKETCTYCKYLPLVQVKPFVCLDYIILSVCISNVLIFFPGILIHFKFQIYFNLDEILPFYRHQHTSTSVSIAVCTCYVVFATPIKNIPFWYIYIWPWQIHILMKSRVEFLEMFFPLSLNNLPKQIGFYLLS